PFDDFGRANKSHGLHVLAPASSHINESRLRANGLGLLFWRGDTFATRLGKPRTAPPDDVEDTMPRDVPAETGFGASVAIDTEFNKLVDLATKVRDETLVADALDLVADAAAEASVWSFGMSMGVFLAAEGIALPLRQVISDQSTELNNKLGTADADIAALINNPNVLKYVTAFKANNSIVTAQETRGMDG
ncbi:hypothetical protein CMUS01_11839, partial [Colletotrichum musicola]